MALLAAFALGCMTTKRGREEFVLSCSLGYRQGSWILERSYWHGIKTDPKQRRGTIR